jgi:hypothetical protein
VVADLLEKRFRLFVIQMCALHDCALRVTKSFAVQTSTPTQGLPRTAAPGPTEASVEQVEVSASSLRSAHGVKNAPTAAPGDTNPRATACELMLAKPPHLKHLRVSCGTKGLASDDPQSAGSQALEVQSATTVCGGLASPIWTSNADSPRSVTGPRRTWSMTTSTVLMGLCVATAGCCLLKMCCGRTRRG